ncbi:envelope integrity protein Cei [Actinokineospora sp.]|uniref:envelope integrity protein Cei n=1 Tax=Actinokineospora sp. TaxID=1872133 RepID=UPI004037F6CF
MAAGNVTSGRRPRQRYRKRRPLPALILIAVLGLSATIVWFRVLRTDDAATAVESCQPPPAVVAVEGETVPTLGRPLDGDALDRTAPAPAAGSLVRVVNASGQNRLAGAVTETLRELGFTQIAPPENDILYPGGSLNCRAQIRFGQQGVAVARTLSILEPCAELLRDERQDGTVDLAVGKRFDHLKPKPEARKVLEQLAEFVQANPDNQGGLQADGTAAAPVEADLIDAARTTRC